MSNATPHLPPAYKPAYRSVGGRPKARAKPFDEVKHQLLLANKRAQAQTEAAQMIAERDAGRTAGRLRVSGNGTASQPALGLAPLDLRVEARKYTTLALTILVEIMTSSKKDECRLRAIDQLFSRGWGGVATEVVREVAPPTRISVSFNEPAARHGRRPADITADPDADEADPDADPEAEAADA